MQENKIILFLKKKKFFLILFFLLIVLFFFKYFSPQKNNLQIIQTIPSNLEKQVNPNTKITFIFNQDIPTNNWKIKTTPEFKYQLSFSRKKMEISPATSLSFQTNYQITISHPKFPNFSYSLIFTTLSETTTTPAKADGLGDPNFYQEISKREELYFPLLKYLPYKTENWEIKTYFGKLKIIVYLKKDTPEIRQEVLDWIKSKQIDPSTHQIDWLVTP